jgi:hypothetical protein
VIAGLWVEAIAAIVQGTPRLPGALCRHQPMLFDGADEETARQAAELCNRCPAHTRCAAWASTLPDNKVTGVIAGRRYTFATHPSLRTEPNGLEIPN